MNVDKFAKFLKIIFDTTTNFNNFTTFFKNTEGFANFLKTIFDTTKKRREFFESVDNFKTFLGNFYKDGNTDSLNSRGYDDVYDEYKKKLFQNKYYKLGTNNNAYNKYMKYKQKYIKLKNLLNI